MTNKAAESRDPKLYLAISILELALKYKRDRPFDDKQIPTFMGGLDVESLDEWIMWRISESDTQKIADMWTTYLNTKLHGLVGYQFKSPTIEE